MNYCKFPARNPYYPRYGFDVELSHKLDPWFRIYDWLVYQDWRSNDRSTVNNSSIGIYNPLNYNWWNTSGNGLLFPIAVIFIINQTLNLQSRRRLIVQAAQLSIVLYVFSATLLTAGEEANRIKGSTEPLLLLLLGAAVSRSLFSQRRRRRKVLHTRMISEA